MRARWQTKTLGELIQLVSGQHIDAKDYNIQSRGIGYLTGPSDFGSINPIVSKWTEFPKVKAKRGDILITVKGSGVGKINLLNQDEIAISRQLMAVRVTGADARFVYAFLSSTFDHFQSESTGAAIPGISREQVLGLKVEVPPLPEQRRIVGILDEAFDGIATAKANTEKNLKNAHALFESHLQAVFIQRGEGWTEKRLGDLSRINYGYTESAYAEKVGPKFLRITDIQDNRVEWSSVPYCPIEMSDYLKYKLADGDIVFARTGATTGKSYLVVDPPESIFASYLIRVQLSTNELLPQFVNLFFQTHSYWDSIRSGVSGSAQGGFNATKLGELVIPFPKSQKEQQSIVAKLDALTTETQRLASLYQHKLAALDALKKSLLHQAFTGQL